MIKKILCFTLLIAFLPNAFATKPMKDDEIKKLIIQGSLREYDERDVRYCPNYEYEEQRKEVKPDSISKQTTREYQYGRYWGLKNIQSETQTQSVEIPLKVFCICPCPYSRDPRGKECGQESAYFGLSEDDKPKCYPEDVQQYEVNDFRSEHGIPNVDTPQPEPKK